MTDADGSLPAGIALVGATAPGAGRWQVSTDGVHWADIGGVGPSSALLLRTTDQLRLLPDGAAAPGPATLTLRAWDGSAGLAGQRADARVAGGSTAFSAATDVATLDVVEDNRAPVLTARQPDLAPTDDAPVLRPGGLSVADLLAGSAVDPDGATPGIAVVGAAATAGQWQVSTDGGQQWQALPALAEDHALLLDAAARLRFVPAGDGAASAALDYRAWDDSSGQAGGLADARVNGGSSAFSSASDTAGLQLGARHQAPQGRDGTLAVGADGHVFGRGDFGFSDPQDTPADTLAAVWIESLPARGTLSLDGRPVQAGERVAVADIDAGRLVFRATPGVDAELVFRVQDDGGTARAGADTDLQPRRLLLRAPAVPDAAPVFDQARLDSVRGGTTPLAASDFVAHDDRTPFAALLFRVDTVAHGRFELAQQPGVAVDRFTGAQLDGGTVRFVHDGGTQAPSVWMSVDDGTQRSQPVLVSVRFSAPTAPAPALPPAGGLPQVPAPALPPVALPPAAPAPEGSGVAATPAGEAPPAAPSGAAGHGGDDVAHDEPGTDRGDGPQLQAPRPRPTELPTAAARHEKPAGLPPVRAPSALAADAVPARPPAMVRGAFDATLLRGLPPLDDGSEAAPRWAAALRPIGGGGTHGAALRAGEGTDGGDDAPPLQIETRRIGLEFGYVAVSTGVVWWATRAGGLLASVLATSPSWRHVDPMFILGDDGHGGLDGDGAPHAASSLGELADEELFEPAGPARG